MDRSAWERLDAALAAACDGSERRRLLYEAMDLAERDLGQRGATATGVSSDPGHAARSAARAIPDSGG
jgi:hypothetical protein